MNPSRTTKRRPLRVALLTNENTPYRVPLYRELAATPNWEFQVFTCTDREFDRLWDVTETSGFATKKSYSFKYMRRQRFGNDQVCLVDKEVHLPIGIVPDLLKFRPDVVLSNEFGARTMLAALTAKLAGHKLIVYSEGTPHTEGSISGSQKLLRRFLCGRPDAYICNGRESREYLETLGISSNDIFEVGQALDLETFDHEVPESDRDSLRAEWGVTGVCYLYVGQLIKFKGIANLVQAWKVFCQDQAIDATLVLAGAGSDRKFLEAEIAEAGLTNVKLLGFIPRQELVTVCSAADVFVFPTLKDCFSLAFEEAMAAGLPVIGSIYGGESELVEEGVNGWVCDPRDHNDLVQKLRLAWVAREALPLMGAQARESVAKMGIDKVAARIRHAVEYALDKSHKTAQRGQSLS
ncbi:MAG: glycosyltransferase family 4 protein [Bythopirellula sp.]|nr:glycosyltransferase family 4 protein [Bythopirellula sp.]